MKNSKIVLLLLSSALSTHLLSAEPSAFGAGDLSSDSPYGLTSEEKIILETKKNLHKVSVKSNNQANELDSLRERIDGLQSIIESLSRKAHNNKITIKKELEENRKKSQSSSEYEIRLSEVVQANEIAIKQQKVVLTEMSLLIDTINSQYVSKEEFNSLIKDVNKFKDLITQELKERNTSNVKPKTVSSLASKSTGEIATESAAYFKKKYYTKAIEGYEYLIEKNYKPAHAHYMIGEMNFKRRKYPIAISYFKKSAALYSKADYMANLMLHTAISMYKTGDKSHAKAFFKAVVSKYPESVEATEAKEYLQK